MEPLSCSNPENELLQRRRMAKQLSTDIMSWIPKLPAWNLIQRAMAMNFRLMMIYGFYTKDEGYQEYPGLESDTK